jgi:hypothetical protein
VPVWVLSVSTASCGTSPSHQGENWLARQAMQREVWAAASAGIEIEDLSIFAKLCVYDSVTIAFRTSQISSAMVLHGMAAFSNN